MTRITLITLGLSLTACAASPSSTTTSQPTSADYDDIAQTIATSTATASTTTTSGSSLGAGDVIAIRDAVSLARGILPFGFLRDRDGHFRGDHMGIANDFTIACKDKSGADQATCNSMTDSATVTVMLKGSLETPNFSASIDREGMWTITGLQSATATLDGSASFSLDTTIKSVFHPGVTSTFMFDNSATYTAITVTTADREITGGSASFEVKAHRTVTGTANGSNDVDKSFDVKADLTFNADHTATLVLDDMHTFTIDLRTGRITKVS
ncbi:MAG TPA: hypothetical protein VIX73_06690 [Kofleriaceae bacterium]|jgi:hypothetical protein